MKHTWTHRAVVAATCGIALLYCLYGLVGGYEVDVVKAHPETYEDASHHPAISAHDFWKLFPVH